MVKHGRELKNLEYLEMCDIATIPICGNEYRNELKKVYFERIRKKDEHEEKFSSKNDLIMAFRRK